MTKKEEAVFESLLTGGIIGVALGALISKSKGAGAALGAIAGAAILASVKANENAQKTDIPLVLEEGNAIYEVSSNGTKKLIKHLPVSNKKLPKKFTLK
jgi:outer membrane lipoprotein SlyB